MNTHSIAAVIILFAFTFAGCEDRVQGGNEGDRRRIAELEKQVAQLQAELSRSARHSDPPHAQSQPIGTRSAATPIGLDRISADTLYAAYQSNKIVANEKYDGHQIVLTGKVWRVGMDEGTPYAVLQGGGPLNVANGLRCMFAREDGPRVVRLPEDGKITVKGRVNGNGY
jgi:hypothetical protein